MRSSWLSCRPAASVRVNRREARGPAATLVSLTTSPLAATQTIMDNGLSHRRPSWPCLSARSPHLVFHFHPPPPLPSWSASRVLPAGSASWPRWCSISESDDKGGQLVRRRFSCCLFCGFLVALWWLSGGVLVSVVCISRLLSLLYKPVLSALASSIIASPHCLLARASRAPRSLYSLVFVEFLSPVSLSR